MEENLTGKISEGYCSNLDLEQDLKEGKNFLFGQASIKVISSIQEMYQRKGIIISDMEIIARAIGTSNLITDASHNKRLEACLVKETKKRRNIKGKIDIWYTQDPLPDTMGCVEEYVEGLTVRFAKKRHMTRISSMQEQYRQHGVNLSEEEVLSRAIGMLYLIVRSSLEDGLETYLVKFGKLRKRIGPRIDIWYKD